MKKSWIKSLLVVIMAVLLVVTLVACNGDKGPVDDGTFTTAKYFDKLWELTSDIGGETIAEDDDLALHFGVVLDLSTLNTRTKQKFDNTSLGIDVQAIVGRTEETAPENTALKVRLYDATAESNGEILTLYMFANDLDNIYIDFCGKNIKVPHDAATNIWNKIVGEENGLNTEIFGGLTDPLGDEEDAKSINDYINDFAGDFGDNWTLNTLINKVLGMMDGFDLKQLLVNNWTIVSGILHLNNVDDIFDANGDINLLKVLKAEFVQKAFIPSAETSEDGVTTYKASLKSDMITMIKSFTDSIKGGFNQAGTALLGSSSDISLLFTEKDNTIDSFSIQAQLGGMTAALGNIPGSGNTSIVPCVTLTITDLRIEKFDSTKNNITLQHEYTEDIALNEKLSFEISGATLKAIEGFTEEDIKLNHKVDITILGKADIINVENNGTKIAVYIDLNGERIATASYANGVLAGKLKDGVTIGGKLYKGFTANVEFNFADKFYGLLEDLVPESWKPGYVEPDEPDQPEDPDQPETPEVDPEEQFLPTADDFAKLEDKDIDEFGAYSINKGAGWTILNWTKLIKSVIDKSNTLRFNNNVTIKSSNILETMVGIINTFGQGTVEVQDVDGYGNLKWETDSDTGEYVVDKNTGRYKPVTSNLVVDYYNITVDGSIDFALNMLKNPPMADLSISQCIDYLLGKEVQTTDEKPSKMRAALRIVNIIASNLVVDGVTVPENSTQYEENIKALLAAEVTIIGDLQNGAHLSVEAKIGGATVKLTESLEVVEIVKDGENATFEIVTVETNEKGELAEGYYDVSQFVNDFLDGKIKFGEDKKPADGGNNQQ